MTAAPGIGGWTGRANAEIGIRGELRQGWRAFLTAGRLGFQIEANWADPLPFLIYAVVKPVFSALILVVMLDIISAGRADPALRAFVVIGSALWSFVVGGLAGFAQSVLEDRERYRMLKYLYVSPNRMLAVILGRGIWRLGIGGFGAAITLLLGVVVLGLPLDVGRADWPLVLVAMVLGLISVVAIGLLMAAVVMQTRQDSWQYPEALGGALFLLVGAVFPLAVLPAAVQWLSLALPLTWWLEAVRQGLFPGMVTSVGGPGSLFAHLAGRSAPDATAMLAVLLLTTLLVTLAAVLAYRWSERRARERGLFDLTTGS